MTTPFPPAIRRARVLKNAGSKVDGQILASAQRRLGDDWLVQSIEDYLGDPVGMLDRHELALAIPAILHHWPAATDLPTPARMWAERNPRKITPDVAKYLDAFAESWLSLWRIRDVQPGVGATVADALTGREAFVHDVAASKSFQLHQGILAIVLDCDGVQFFGGLFPFGLESGMAQEAEDAVRNLLRVRSRPVALKRLRDPRTHQDLVDLWKTMVEEEERRPLPELRNTEGDPIVPTTDEFALEGSRAEAMELLASLPGATLPLRQAGEDFVQLTRATDASKGKEALLIATIVMTKQGLRIETNSARRADETRTTVEALLGERVRHRRRRESDLAPLLEKAMKKGPPAGEPQSSPEESEYLREFRERYMRDWLDQQIPAIDGMTPREAAKLPKMRKKLMRLIEHVEAMESAMPTETRIDLGFLRKDLGLK